MATIEGYRFGRVMIDGEEHTRDVIVLPARIVAGWRRRDGHALVIEDLEGIVDELPPTLILGTGADERMRPDPRAIEMLRERGTDVEALPTAEAVRRYGELDPQRTALAMHLTC